MSDKQGEGLAMARPWRTVGLVLATVLALMALALVPSSAPGSVVTDYPLCTADGNQTEPAAHGDRVVWVDQRANPSGWLGDIWMFDYATGEETQITDDEYEQTDPDLWGDWVVWSDWSGASGDVYAKNVVTDEEIAVCTNDATQQRPKICDDVIVWEDYRNGGWDIYSYRISTGEEVCLDSDRDDRSPDVFRDGDDYIVAWEGGGDLYVANLDTSDDRVPMEDIYGATLVAGDDEVVFGRFEEREGAGTSQLYLYRLSWSDIDPIEIPTSYEPYAEFHALSASGDKVAYAYDAGISFKVRVHDWEQGTETSVSGADSDQYSPAIAGDMVVWRDDRNSPGSGNDYYDLYTNREVALESSILTINAAATIVPYKGTTTLTVHLTDDFAAPLSGYLVDVQSSIDWGATWPTFATIESDGGTVATPALTQATKFRASWAGAGEYGASTSSYVLVTPKVYLDAPRVPDYIQKDLGFLVYGNFKPRHAVGWNEAVKLYCWRKNLVTGEWVLKKTAWCKTIDFLTYSRYQVSIALPSTGVWKLRAYAPEDRKHAATWSAATYCRVR